MDLLLSLCVLIWKAGLKQKPESEESEERLLECVLTRAGEQCGTENLFSRMFMRMLELIAPFPAL